MATRLFIVHGSHPSAAVRKALDLKGVDYKLFEFTPPSHALGMRVLFGGRTVPGVRFDDGEKVQGSLAIMQALERRYPDPPLYPSDLEARAAVVEAERWGEATFQPVARRLIWPAFQRRPDESRKSTPARSTMRRPSRWSRAAAIRRASNSCAVAMSRSPIGRTTQLLPAAASRIVSSGIPTGSPSAYTHKRSSTPKVGQLSLWRCRGTNTATRAAAASSASPLTHSASCRPST